MTPPLCIDGAQGEGGGQILRTALALSIITGRAVALHNIRAQRPKPGLMRQHLACVQAAAQISGAQVQGDALGAQTLAFAPGPVRAGDYRFAIASAGSAMLVLQTVLPALLLADAPSTVHVTGGTHNPMAPCFHFVQGAYAPLVRRLGAGLELRLLRAGFYPAGGGQVAAEIAPGPLTPFDLRERGELLQVQAQCLAPALARHVAPRELAVLGDALGWSPEHLHVVSAQPDEGPGNALVATLRFAHLTEVFTQLGEKAVSAESVAQRLARQVRRYQGSLAALGPHLADQWVLLLALAVWRSGSTAAFSFSCSQATPHLYTNAAVIERFLPLCITVQPLGARVASVRVEPRLGPAVGATAPAC